MQYGRQFENEVVGYLRNVFGLGIETSEELDRKGIDWVVTNIRGKELLVEEEFQLTIREASWRKSRRFREKMAERDNGRARTYVVVDDTVPPLIVAQAVNRVLWRDLINWSEPGALRVLRITSDCLEFFISPEENDRVLKMSSGAQIGGAHKRGRIINVSGGLMVKAGGKLYRIMGHRSFVDSRKFEGMKERKRLHQGMMVTFKPGKDGNGYLVALAVRIAKSDRPRERDLTAAV